MMCPECGSAVELAASIVMDELVVVCREDCSWYLELAFSEKGQRILEQLNMRLEELVEE